MDKIIDLTLDPVTNFGKITISTGYTNIDTIIVLSSGHGAKILTHNCINGGISKSDIEEIYVTAPEYDALRQSSKTSEQLSAENIEKLIQEEIRTIAIERLTTKRLI